MQLQKNQNMTIHALPGLGLSLIMLLSLGGPTFGQAVYAPHLISQTINTTGPINNKTDNLTLDIANPWPCSDTTNPCTWKLNGEVIWTCPGDWVHLAECGRQAEVFLKKYVPRGTGTATYTPEVCYRDHNTPACSTRAGARITVQRGPPPRDNACVMILSQAEYDLGTYEPSKSEEIRKNFAKALRVTCLDAGTINLTSRVNTIRDEWVELYHQGKPLASGVDLPIKELQSEEFAIEFRAKPWKAEVGLNTAVFVVYLSVY